ncbi:cell division protein FtsK [Pseudofrankia inefficax]|uniref:Cell division protein FtsK/SpoIIIE n=1 Tax=Pseudofrankia inefficax (strain DSM 45817 / CECT 9037 / DDB 130130 / EuI1c) TaxID=298654 RepID=E3J664_PSEI1|nr:cell division protein FtsK [Pseudofrankia inefficax]ADP78355.1 cell division protein FtsK/SpoIIIE [Pseudofrankia inefficax]
MTEPDAGTVTPPGGLLVAGPWAAADAPDEEHTPVAVDQAPAVELDGRPWEVPPDRRPVVAPWVRDVRQLRRVAWWAAGEALHPVAFHAARLPLYTGRLAAGSPRGAARSAATVARWALDAGGAERLGDVDRKDTPAYLALSAQRDARLRRRLPLVGVSLLAGGIGDAVLYTKEPTVFGLTTAAGVLALGAVGRRRDRPLLDSPTTVSGRAPKLTSDIVERALAHCGLPADIAKKITANGLEWVAPIAIDGPGWRAEFDLPYGVTVAEVAEHRDKLASGLRRPLGAVWPEPESDAHPGRMVLWVGKDTLAKSKAPAWPLLNRGQADIFAPLPFGFDQRLRPVSVPLIFDSILIGAMPRYGKTMALRVLLLGAALDPSVLLYIYELKGTGDLSSPGEQVAHRYASGAGNATLAACMDGLREVHAELERRADIIRGLPKSVCPENKVTPELSRRPGSGLAPILFSIDECQELFSSKEHKDEATELAVAIMKRGPALGIILALATQRPSRDSLPLDISANIGIRLCLRVAGHVENNMILGTGMSARGVQAYTFTRRDKGIAYLAGVEDDPIVVRGAYLDAPAAERVADRARAIRAAAGLLTGHAAGEVVERDEDTPFAFLADAVQVAEDRTHLAVLAGRLADGWPERYTTAAGEPWTAQQIGAQLRTAGVEVEPQMWATGTKGTATNAVGVTRDAIRQAIAARSGQA